MKKFRTIALLGRDTGLAVLKDALINHPYIDLIGVFTHSRLTKAEGGGARSELVAFKQICAKERIPLTILDYPEAKFVEEHMSQNPVDLVILLSWKFILNPRMISRINIAGINLHRGALPKYAYLEPIRRALEAGETRLAITAHHIIEDVDMGPEIARLWINLPSFNKREPLIKTVKKIKAAYLPLYAPLTRLAIDSIVQQESLKHGN